RPHAPRAASGIRSVPATLTATLLAVVFGSASFFLMPYLNVIGYVTAIWLVILTLLDRPQMFERARGWWIAAARLLLIYPLSQDPAGLSAGVAWLAAVGGIAWIALTIRPAEAFAYRAALLPRRFAWWTAAALPLALLAVGLGKLGASTGNPSIFTPALRDIWLAVRCHTPPDALI